MGLERNEIVSFWVLEDVGVLEDEVKIEERADKWTKCCNSSNMNMWAM